MRHPLESAVHRATPRELAWARVIIETMFPGCGTGDLEGFVASTLEAVPATSAAGLRAAVAVATLAPLAVLRRSVLLPRLRPAERLAVLERLGRSDVYPVRGAFMLLKAV